MCVRVSVYVIERACARARVSARVSRRRVLGSVRSVSVADPQQQRLVSLTVCLVS